MKDQIREVLNWTILEVGNLHLQVADLIKAVMIFAVAKLLIWLLKQYFERKRKEGKIDVGKQYAYMQLLSYVIYVIAIILIIENLGFSITVILAGSTALLVGLGLGLQDFFRDLVAGFIILSERTVSAGDVVEIGGEIGKVKEVGLRTTHLITRNDIIVIVPNTRLTADNVINWSQNERMTRFRITLGVAYGSDTELVRQVLLECAEQHADVLKIPEPSVFFDDFGDSALIFSLLFFSKNLFRIERTKSELRFMIDAKFREQKIQIPFPQRDVWIKQSSPKQI